MKWLELYRLVMHRPLALDTLANHVVAALQANPKLAVRGTRIADVYLACLTLDAHSVAVADAVAQGVGLACAE